MSFDVEVGDRLDAISRWVDHARKAECDLTLALGAIEALALAGLQHIGSNGCMLGVQQAARACDEHPGPGQPLTRRS